MSSSKTIFVTGATGNQGGAVVKSLLDKGFKVKALTRNSSSRAATGLQSIAAEVVQGDLNDTNSYKKFLQDVQGVFSVQAFINGTQKEIEQGIKLADLVKEYHIDHLVYSSVIGADLQTGIPHWESKYKIENHIRELGQPFTIIRPS